MTDAAVPFGAEAAPIADAPPSELSPEARAARHRRRRDYFLILARRAEASPEAAEILPKLLGDDLAEYLEPALEAAMLAAESLDGAEVYPVLDAALARLLREKQDLHLVAELYNRIPLDTVLLKETGLEVFHQTVMAMEARNSVELHPVESITFLLNYVHRLMQADHLAEAEEWFTKAVKLAREGYLRDPKGFQDGLISSLEVGAVLASARGRYAEAQQLREEAIGLLRKTPGEERMLAQCLSNRSGTRKSLGDLPGAREDSEEAVRLYRMVVAGAAETPTNFSSGLQAWVDSSRPQLGDALIALSTHRQDANDFPGSLAAAKEAVEIFRELSADFPDAFRQHYGMARHNLGMARFGVGDAAGGLREIQESAEVYSRLVTAHRGAYLPTYERVLASLAKAYYKNALFPEALAQMELCVAACRELYQQAPDRFVDRLTESLGDLAFLYEQTGRPEAAKAAASELGAVSSRASAGG